MKTLNAIILCLSIATASFAQNQLEMFYNLHTDEIKYFRNGEQLETPFVKTGENIKVIIEEFNPYITTAHVKVDQYNYSQQSFAPVLGQGGDYINSGMGGIASLVGGFSSGSSAQDEYGDIPGSRGASSKQIMQAKTQFQQLSSQLAALETVMNNSHEKLTLYNNAEKSQRLALADINSLKTNENIKPSRIKELIEEELRYAFAKMDNKEIDIDDIVDADKKKQELFEAIDAYKKAVSEYKKLAMKWGEFSTFIGAIGDTGGDEQMDYIKENTDEVIAQISNKKEKMQDIKFDNLVDFDNAVDVETLAFLRQVNEEIKSNDFTYTFSPIQAKGDAVDLSINFARQTPSGEYHYYKNLEQSVEVTGNWKVAAGLGIAFGKLGKQQYDYKVINGVIVADEADDFLPIVSTFIHVYKQSPKALNLGGSFGIGMPIVGGGSGASFFLGPTLSIGKSSRVLITSGLMGTQTDRLSNGLSTGDLFQNEAAFLPFEKRYELGYFLGVSFSVLR